MSSSRKARARAECHVSPICESPWGRHRFDITRPLSSLVAVEPVHSRFVTSGVHADVGSAGACSRPEKSYSGCVGPRLESLPRRTS
jgi:hypothetical protein